MNKLLNSLFISLLLFNSSVSAASSDEELEQIPLDKSGINVVREYIDNKYIGEGDWFEVRYTLDNQDTVVSIQDMFNSSPYLISKAKYQLVESGANIYFHRHIDINNESLGSVMKGISIFNLENGDLFDWIVDRNYKMKL